MEGRIPLEHAETASLTVAREYISINTVPPRLIIGNTELDEPKLKKLLALLEDKNYLPGLPKI